MTVIKTAKQATSRLTQHYRYTGQRSNPALMLIHGNGSSSVFFNDLMQELSAQYFVIAPDLTGYGDTEAVAIDATQGVRNWSDDLAELMTALDINSAHLLGWSLGGGVAMQFLIDHPDRVRSLTLEAPVSPFGFGGTLDVAGRACYQDYAGTGGGTVNPEFVKRLQQQDRTAADPNSPRNVISAFYFKPPFQAACMDDLLEGLLKQQVGDGFYPGDMQASENWPNVAPGKLGPVNALSPAYFNTSAIVDVVNKCPVLWIRGADDQIVSDTSFFDFGTLGQAGYVPGWPGSEVMPPQPMIAQTDAVLTAYAAAGGQVDRVVFEDCGHSPHLEKADAFAHEMLRFLADASR